MAQFQNMIITRAGLDMIAQSQAGGTLIFTKGKLGDGQIGDQSIPDLTDLINAKMSVDLSSVTAKSDGHVEVKFIVDNVNLDSGFFVREVGIFAKVNEEGVEKLYGYANAGNYTNYLSDKTVPIDSIITKIDLVVGNASDVAFTTDKSIIYVTLEDAENAFNIHNEAPDAHPNDFNLKGLTIGKDNVIATKKGDLLTLLAGKGINLLSDIKNKIITVVGKSKNAWNPNEEIIAGDIRYTEDGNGPSWAYLLCKTAGTTGTVEPTLEANAVVGQEINDGSVVWMVQKNSNALSFAGKEAELFALLNSPDFKGTPTAPTAAKTVNNTQIATTAFVHLLAGAANNGGIVDSLLAQNGYVKFANGLILQWGYYTAAVGAIYTDVTTPVSFSKCFIAESIDTLLAASTTWPGTTQTVWNINASNVSKIRFIWSRPPVELDGAVWFGIFI